MIMSPRRSTTLPTVIRIHPSFIQTIIHQNHSERTNTQGHVTIPDKCPYTTWSGRRVKFVSPRLSLSAGVWLMKRICNNTSAGHTLRSYSQSHVVLINITYKLRFISCWTSKYEQFLLIWTSKFIQYSI